VLADHEGLAGAPANTVSAPPALGLTIELGGAPGGGPHRHDHGVIRIADHDRLAPTALQNKWHETLLRSTACIR